MVAYAAFVTRYDKEQSTETMLFWQRRRVEVDAEVCMMFNVYNVHKVILRCIIKEMVAECVTAVCGANGQSEDEFFGVNYKHLSGNICFLSLYNILDACSYITGNLTSCKFALEIYTKI